MTSLALSIFALILSMAFPARTLIMLIAIDQLLFAILTLGECKRGETISAAADSLLQAGKWQGRWAVPIIDALFWLWEKDHCHKSWLAERFLYSERTP